MPNTAEFAWKDITVTMMGQVVEGHLEIEYDTEVDQKHIYGRGKKPLGVQSGNEKPTATIAVRQSVMESWIRKAKSINPLWKPIDMSIDINVVYLLPGSLDKVRDRIVGFRPSKMPKSMKQGDTDMQVKVPGLPVDIQYDI